MAVLVTSRPRSMLMYPFHFSCRAVSSRMSYSWSFSFPSSLLYTIRPRLSETNLNVSLSSVGIPISHRPICSTWPKATEVNNKKNETSLLNFQFVNIEHITIALFGVLDSLVTKKVKKILVPKANLCRLSIF